MYIYIHLYKLTHVYTCMCVHICINVCARVFVYTYIHTETYTNLTHTYKHRYTHIPSWWVHRLFFYFSRSHTLLQTHPGYIFFNICLIIPLVEFQVCILLNLILKMENLPLCNIIGLNHGPFHQTLKPSCSHLVRVSFHTRDNV